MTVAREFMETDARATGVLLGCVCSLDLEAKEYTSVSSVFPGSFPDIEMEFHNGMVKRLTRSKP